MFNGMNIEVKITDADLYKDTLHPSYATPGACAIDLRSAVDVIIKPGETFPINTGIRIHVGSVWRTLPEPEAQELRSIFGLAAFVIPRSGLGAKKGLVLGNSVGLIDEDYQGDITCYMWNRQVAGNGYGDISIRRGERIAQMTFVMVCKPAMVIVSEFSETTERGIEGFGSTGRQ